MLIRICKRFTFEAAHRLPLHVGKCQNLHGHSYKLEVEIKGTISTVSGMVMDFADLKEIVRPVVEKFDHELLNDTFGNPTAEHMILYIVSILREKLEEPKEGGTKPFSSFRSVSRVRLWETETCYAEWRREDQYF